MTECAMCDNTESHRHQLYVANPAGHYATEQELKDAEPLAIVLSDMPIEEQREALKPYGMEVFEYIEEDDV